MGGHSLCSHRKRKRNDQERDDQPYIKKPPNAFMLFRKEQRSKVGADMGVTDSALINTILGQRVSVYTLYCVTEPI